LADKITDVITNIGVKKVAAVVTDNAPNIAKAQNIIEKQFSNIINLRCITHFVNLITKDIISMFK